MAKTTFKRQATALAELGYLVFPLQTNGKIPMAGSSGCNDGTIDPAKIKAWAAQYPNANVGIHCTGLVVIDLDEKDGKTGIADLDEVALELGSLPESPVVVTPTGGRHLYFKAPPVTVKNAQSVKWKGRKTGIDIRTDGGYAVAPGSVIDGKSYKTVNFLPPVDELPELPQTWIDGFLTHKPSSIPLSTFILPPTTADADILRRAEAYLDRVDPSIQGQDGSGTMYRAVSSIMWGFNLDDDTVKRLIFEHYNLRAVPPWAEWEIDHKINDAREKPLQKPAGWLLAEQGNSTMNADISGLLNPTTPSSQKSSKSLSEIFPDWLGAIVDGKSPVRFQCDDEDSPMNVLAPEAESITTIGGAPGTAKTALIQQIVFESLYRNPDLNAALICNIEQSPTALLNRELARLSRIPYNVVRNRNWADEVFCQDRLDSGLETLRQIGDRVYFQEFPFEIERIVEEARRIDAKIVVIDYVQKIETRVSHLNSDRERIAIILNRLRELASEGRSILMASALSRYSGVGRSYESPTLGSFRDSSDLEFSSTNAWILAVPLEGSNLATEKVNRTLWAAKRKEDEPCTLYFHFDGNFMNFTVEDVGEGPPGAENRSTANVRKSKPPKKKTEPEVQEWSPDDEF